VLAKIDTQRLYSVCWYSTSDGTIATPIVALTLTLIPLYLINSKFRELWSSNLWDLVADLQGVGGCT